MFTQKLKKKIIMIKIKKSEINRITPQKQKKK